MSDAPSNHPHRALLWRLGLAVVAMFGFAFALVPLYQVFCDLTGINGRTASVAAVYEGPLVDQSRYVTIEFIAMTQGSMPWRFKPLQRRLKVHPGELHMAEFEVENLTAKSMVGQAIPSVSPGPMATYLHKTECFCFNRQPLAAGEKKQLPLRFFIDADIPEEIQTITLSYTLFDITAMQSGEGVSAPATGR